MKTIYMFIFIYLISFSMFAQTVHTVDNRPNSGAQFTSAQAAHDAATAGDIIQMHPSATNYGDVAISKQLTWISIGHNPENSNEGTYAQMRIFLSGNAANSVFTGLYITAVGNTGSITNLENVQFVNNYFLGNVSLSSSISSDNNWLFRGNVFETATLFANGSSGWVVENNLCLASNQQFSNFNSTCSIVNNTVFLTGSSTNNVFNNSTAIVDNNIFVMTGNSTTVGVNDSSISFNNCITFSFQGNTITPLSGNNNIDNTNPLFVNVPMATATDFYNNDYNLQAGSPGIDAGTDGTNIGLSGLNFTFDVNGRPDLYPYMTSINIVNSTLEPGQTLEVEFTAEKKQ